MAVYFIQAGENGPIKIGTAIDPVSRCAEFQCGHYEALSIIRLIDGSYREEAWAHQQFAHLRVRGEWFRFDPEMLTFTPASAEKVKPLRPVTEAEQIISAFGGLTRMSEKMSRVSVSTISEWRRNGTFPRWRYSGIAEAARAHTVLLPRWFWDRIPHEPESEAA